MEAGVLSDASAGIGIASRQGCGRLKHLEVKLLRVQEKVSQRAILLLKHSTETSIADLATKYLARPRMETMLAAGNLVLFSGERVRSGEYILEDSVQNQFRIIVVLFLGLGIIFFMSVLLYVYDKHDGHQLDCIEGGYGSDRLDHELEIADSKGRH